eukprot:TRINITY_DN715_c0_g3_i3.p1 TRINITY_DN715_c0_g3~~TRINITY_DN715_c0_g3_i3.p1  ORF type:complete len:299 (+),score=91.61 TRINITY_DN715_c0_g3_i3:1535-2431(+)
MYDTENAEFLLDLNGEGMKLPGWASSAIDCVRKLNEALESDYVSQSLHHWIDLTFGYRMDQKSEDSKEERNETKEHAYKFGQMPHQIFTEPHPHRRVRMEALPVEASSEIYSREELHSMVSTAQEELKVLRAEFAKASREYDESLKKHFNNYKAYENKCKQRNDKVRAAYKEQKEKYRKAIMEMQSKNASLKDDFEQLEQKKEKHYLEIMKNMKDNYKKDMNKHISKSQIAAHISELEKRVQRHQVEEKRCLANVKKLTEANKELEDKNAELQQTLEHLEKKAKPSSPSCQIQKPHQF